MSTDKERDRKIVNIANRQSRLITWRQLADLGVTWHGVKSRSERGMLRRVERGVYETSFESGWPRRAAAVCLALGKSAVLSHRSAARVWDLNLPRLKIELIEATVTLGHSTARSSEHLLLHRTRHLPQRHRVHRADLPVTSCARTFADVAMYYGKDELELALDDAMSKRLLRPGSLSALLNEPAMRSRPNSRLLRNLVEAWLDGPMMESVAEAPFFRALQLAGKTPPALQYKIYDGREFVARVDFAWPDLKVAVEMEGARFHSSPRAHALDLLRTNRLVAAGWVVLRISPLAQKSALDQFLANLDRVLRERGAVA